MEKHYKVLKLWRVIKDNQDNVITEEKLEEMWNQGWRLLAANSTEHHIYYYFQNRNWF